MDIEWKLENTPHSIFAEDAKSALDLIRSLRVEIARQTKDTARILEALAARDRSLFPTGEP